MKVQFMCSAFLLKKRVSEKKLDKRKKTLRQATLPWLYYTHAAVKRTFHEIFYQQYGPSVFLIKVGQEELWMERMKRPQN